VDGRCARHTRAAKKKAEYGARRVPRDRRPHVGVEIEVVAADDDAFRAIMSQRLTPHHDGSLPELGVEFKLLARAEKIIALASCLARRLRECGATVTSKCGLHVHLDCRDVPRERQRAVLHWMDHLCPWLFSIMPPSRRNNSYLTPAANSLTDHYRWVNLTPYKTLECRIHGGTLNPHKIAGWLSVMLDILDHLHGSHELPLMEVDLNAPTRRPTLESLRAAFPRTAGREYLIARQTGNGVLDAYETEVRECA
jgi:hypothetical protein